MMGEDNREAAAACAGSHWAHIGLTCQEGEKLTFALLADDDIDLGDPPLRAGRARCPSNPACEHQKGSVGIIPLTW